MNDDITKSSKVLLCTSYAYLILPFFIFAIGWMGKRYWIPIVILLTLCYWKMCKDTPTFWMPKWNRDNIMKVIFVVLVVCIWVYFSGIGRYVFQNSDHNCRNAIFEILVSYDWPIVNYDLLDSTIALEGNATSLIYYIGFWLPAAVVGKIMGIEAGYTFQYLWAVVGILLIYYIICANKEKLMIWPLAILIFFSGLDIAGMFFSGVNLGEISSTVHLEWWMTPYQFSSMTTQLFWVFNQAIPAWLCTMLLYVQKNNKSIILIWSCCMLSSTFPFAGLLPLVVYWIFSRTYTMGSFSKNIFGFQYFKLLIANTCTFQNIVGGGIVGIFSFLYLSGNLSGNIVMGANALGSSYVDHPIKYIIFIIFEVGIFLILLYKRNKNNLLYYMLILLLLLVPLIRIGSGSDFCMRASIPALFLLMILVIDVLNEGEKCDKKIFVSLIVTLIIGSITPIHEFSRTVQETVDRVNNSEQIYETTVDSITILNHPNFSGIIDNNFFFRYIAR